MPEYNVNSNQDLEDALAIVEPGDTISKADAASTTEIGSPEADAPKTK